MSDNWIVQNLENALEVWNDKLSEIWQLITQSPQTFKGGSIWSVITSIHGALQAIGYALLVLFFVVGVVKTCGSFADLKKPEHAVKLFVRFAIAKGLISYGMELMLAILEIIQGVVSTIMNSAGFGTPQATILPQEIVTAVEDCGFFESIPLWAVTLIGGLFVWVLSFVMILSVYGRFFKMYMYTAIAPVPLSTFAGEPTQNIGKSFLKSYASVCMEGAIIVLACIIFSVFASSPPVVDTSATAASMVWSYIGELIFNMLILVGAVKMADRLTDSNLNHTGIYLYSKGKIMIHLTFDYQSDEGCTTPGQYLRYHRTFQGLTTRELAEKVGVVPATLVLYENDRHPIKHSTAVALANVLGIDRSRLLDEYTVFVDYPYSSLLKKVRRELSFTQMQMAEVIGIGQTTYSGWEREVRVPRRKEHEKILAAMKKLKVDVDTYLCQPNPL